MAKLTKAKVKGKKPITREVVFPADDADEKALREAVQREQRATFLGDKAEIEKAKAELKEIRDGVVERGLVFEFRGIGRKPYQDLVELYVPTPEQKAKAKAAEQPEPQWNVDLFPAALCAASAVDSDLTEDDWRTEVFDSPDFGPGELGALFNAALEANSDRRVAQLGN